MVTFSEMPAHESQKCQNLNDTVKAVLTENFIEVNVYIKKDIKHNLTLHFTEPDSRNKSQEN